MPDVRADPPPLLANHYERTYLVLAGIFLGALVACNLIFQKFFVVDIPLPGGHSYRFEQSVGLLAYPVTFLVTDILSEIYGAKRANAVVTGGFAASVLVVVLIEIADAVPSASYGIGDEAFTAVFGLSKVAVFSSMVAYLVAQYVDIRLFHFWRRLTKGKHLWLRNNASTFASQFIDTFLVLALLASLSPQSGITWQNLPALMINGLVFKWVFAALDTPLFYAAVAWFKRRYPEQVAAMAEPA